MEVAEDVTKALKEERRRFQKRARTIDTGTEECVSLEIGGELSTADYHFLKPQLGVHNTADVVIRRSVSRMMASYDPAAEISDAQL